MSSGFSSSSFSSLMNITEATLVNEKAGRVLSDSRRPWYSNAYATVESKTFNPSSSCSSFLSSSLSLSQNNDNNPPHSLLNNVSSEILSNYCSTYPSNFFSSILSSSSSFQSMYSNHPMLQNRYNFHHNNYAYSPYQFANNNNSGGFIPYNNQVYGDAGNYAGNYNVGYERDYAGGHYGGAFYGALSGGVYDQYRLSNPLNKNRFNSFFQEGAIRNVYEKEEFNWVKRAADTLGRMSQLMDLNTYFLESIFDSTYTLFLRLVYIKNSLSYIPYILVPMTHKIFNYFVFNSLKIYNHCSRIENKARKLNNKDDDRIIRSCESVCKSEDEVSSDFATQDYMNQNSVYFYESEKHVHEVNRNLNTSFMLNNQDSFKQYICADSLPQNNKHNKSISNFYSNSKHRINAFNDCNEHGSTNMKSLHEKDMDDRSELEDMNIEKKTKNKKSFFNFIDTQTIFLQFKNTSKQLKVSAWIALLLTIVGVCRMFVLWKKLRLNKNRFSLWKDLFYNLRYNSAMDSDTAIVSPFNYNDPHIEPLSPY